MKLKTKEELVGGYLKYDESFTEEIWDKIVARLLELGFREGGYDRGFKHFIKRWPILKIDKKEFHLVHGRPGGKQLQLPDLIDIEWYKDLKKGDYIVVTKTCGNGNLNYIYPYTPENGCAYGLTEGYIYIRPSVNILECNCRLATTEEIKLYEHAGKPVDVTTYKIPKKKNYTGKVVHCTSQEELDFAQKKCRPDAAMYNNIQSLKDLCRDYPEGIALSIKNNSYSGLGHWKALNYQILSFQEWLDENGYTFNSKEEFKVGDYVVVSNNVLSRYNKLKYKDVAVKVIEGVSLYGNINVDIPYNSDGGLLVPPKDLRKATQEEIAAVNPPGVDFEFNKWYSSKKHDGLFYVETKDSGYGFAANGSWFTRTPNMGEWDLKSLNPATDFEVEEKLLSYAKEKYAIGTIYKCPSSGCEPTVIKQKFNKVDETTIYGENGKGCLLYQGKWAEIISKPKCKIGEITDRETISSKPNNTIIQTVFDRNWYVKVNSQEEANAIFDWLEDQGEKINRTYTKVGTGGIYYYLVFYRDEGWVISNHGNAKERKTLSDILPDYLPAKKEVDEEVCKYCEDTIIEGSSNCSTFSCEGSFCEQALDGYNEDNGFPDLSLLPEPELNSIQTEEKSSIRISSKPKSISIL